jgi:hypothetical protein
MTTSEHPYEEQQQREMAEQIRQLTTERERLEKSNEQAAVAVGLLGAQVDPASLVRMRLDAFIDFIFARMGNTSDEIRKVLSLQFEIEYNSQVAAALESVKAEVRKAQLGAGAGLSQDDLKKMFGNGHGPGPGGGLHRP